MSKDDGGVGEVEIMFPLGEAAGSFDLERDVCSHGLFMMAPNQWDSSSRTFSRPLRLLPNSDFSMVSISQPSTTPDCLVVRVRGTHFLSEDQRQSLLRQTTRMLRLSEEDERVAKEFKKMAGAAKGDAAVWMAGFGGRVFRSPTLFEDMVKCILLCNCQFSRTLSMAKSLCDLQLELHSRSRPNSNDFAPLVVRKEHFAEAKNSDDFAPRTPARKDRKRKRRTVNDLSTDSAAVEPGEYLSGNFPSPEELANLDEKFLAKRCNVGYRASRIIKLAKGIVQGDIPLKEFEEISACACLSTYEKLEDQLGRINGFGPFTCSNVLMCMGFYHAVPADSETIRHLKQVHGKVCSTKTVHTVVRDIYREYDPLQFLVYWAELWYFYEQRFGKLSELPCAAHSRITASNMRDKAIGKTSLNVVNGDNISQ